LTLIDGFIAAGPTNTRTSACGWQKGGIDSVTRLIQVPGFGNSKEIVIIDVARIVAIDFADNENDSDEIMLENGCSVSTHRQGARDTCKAWRAWIDQ
jgi:hypothetical protein